MTFELGDIQLPKKISPCPIVEAIIEIRFESVFPENSIFGIIYKEFKDEFPKFEELAIVQLPEIIKKSDDSLKYKPYYKLTKEKNDGLSFQIGPRVLSLTCLKPYVGWGVFFIALKVF